MNRIVFYAEGEDLGYIFKEYSRYYIKLITDNTKTYYAKAGAFYVTKFNPEALVMEALRQENNPIIRPIPKNKLLDASKELSGSNLSYSIVRSQERGMLGIVFEPITDEQITEIMRMIND